ncbi:MAG: fibronectin type III domain-containing protein, partial [Oscillospiraceae bacterium]|nr:fibronectin type III domain-containing protein [Oscillospiraceae bacterium]
MLLAILMCFSMLPTSLAADETQTDSETAENIVVTFETDEHTTVDLYYSKDNYETADETDVTSAYVRGKGSTEIDNSGDGQVNFKVNADEGYTYTVEVDPETGYNNCKGEDETGAADIWRITKISSDLTVTITSAAESSEGEDTESGEGTEQNEGAEAEWVPTDLVVNIGAAEDSISVVWYDISADAGTLTFGGKEYTADISAASREGYYINRVSVTDLQPSTDYTYTITSGDGETSQIYTYTTTDFGEGKTFSFAIVGDPQIGASGNADSDTEGW